VTSQLLLELCFTINNWVKYLLELDSMT